MSLNSSVKKEENREIATIKQPRIYVVRITKGNTLRRKKEIEKTSKREWKPKIIDLILHGSTPRETEKQDEPQTTLRTQTSNDKIQFKSCKNC